MPCKAFFHGKFVLFFRQARWPALRKGENPPVVGSATAPTVRALSEALKPRAVSDVFAAGPAVVIDDAHGVVVGVRIEPAELLL